MTNVVAFQPRPAPLGAADLVDNLETLQLFTIVASELAQKAKTVPKIIHVYANWLRRYYELSGGISSAYVHLKDDVEERGRESDDDRLDSFMDAMVAVETLIKGSLPWTALPNLTRTKGHVLRILTTATKEIFNAIVAARSIGQSGAKPGGAA